MKKILLFILFACVPFMMKAQSCFAQIATTPTSCFGGCDGTATCFPVGTAPFTFMWSPGGQTTQNIGGLCAGTYTVTMMDGTGCVASANATVTQPPQIVVISSTVPATCPSCCNGIGMVSATGGTGAYVYNWSPSGGTGPTAANLCPGSYTCCVTDMNGCVACATVIIGFTTGLNDPSATGYLSVFPSPTTQVLTIDETFANATSAEISFCNLLGEIVFAKTSDSKTQLHETINVAELPRGIYFVTVKTVFGSSVQRFVKE